MNKSQLQKPDVNGLATLDAIAVADEFNRWMYETIKPFCHGNTIEIGSGTGNISQFFLKDKFRMTLSDIQFQYCQLLEQRFKDQCDTAIVQLDIAHPEFSVAYAPFLQKFDCVVALNVIEHVRNDDLALRNCYSLLKEGGTVVILVPSYPALYNRFDIELRHYRRYTKSSLSQALKKSNFKLVHMQHFNMMGITGWYLYGSVLKQKLISKELMYSYNKLVPLFKLLDRISFNTLGLSLIAVGKKD